MLYDSDPLNQTSLHTLNNDVSLIKNIFEDLVNQLMCVFPTLYKKGRKSPKPFS